MAAVAPASGGRRGLSPERPLAALLAPPRVDPRVVARQQDVRDTPALKLRGPGVLRKLEPAFERGGEALVRPALLAQRAREPASDSFEHDHGGQLAPGQDVGADRNRVGREVLEHALVEAFEAGGEEREGVLGGELLDELLVELAPLRRE